MTESTTLAHSLLDDEDIPTKGPFDILSIGDRVSILIARYHVHRDALQVLRKEHDERHGTQEATA